MADQVSCPVGFGIVCGGLSGRTDKERFAAVASHVMEVHGVGPAEAFEAAGRVLPWVWADYMRDAREHPERYRRDAG
jgi:hypothetical protein